MLTLLITANVEQENLAEKHLEKIQAISKLEKSLEVVFLVKSNFKQLQALKYITVNVQNHFTLIADPSTTEDEMIQMGLEFASGNDVLLCTIDTKPEVLSAVLEKKTNDRKIIWVRKKTNRITQFFRAIGNSAYNLGLMMLGKNNDNFAETRIQYFDGRVASNLATAVTNNRELRITNSFKQVQSGVVEQPQIYYDDNKKDWKERAMLSLGIVSFIYIIALLALAVLYPIFNNMVYSWWMIIVLVVWVFFGIFGIIYTSKRMFKVRCGIPLRADEDGYPVYNLLEMIQFGDPLTSPKQEEMFEKGIIKNLIKIDSCLKSNQNTEVQKPEKVKNVFKKEKKPVPKNKTLKKSKIVKNK